MPVYMNCHVICIFGCASLESVHIWKSPGNHFHFELRHKVDEAFFFPLSTLLLVFYVNFPTVVKEEPSFFFSFGSISDCRTLFPDKLVFFSGISQLTCSWVAIRARWASPHFIIRALLLQRQKEQGIQRQGALSLLGFSRWSWHGRLWSLRRRGGGRRY